jgi:hypothetical protein
VGESTAHDAGMEFFSSSFFGDLVGHVPPLFSPIRAYNVELPDHPAVRRCMMRPISCIRPCGDRTSEVDYKMLIDARASNTCPPLWSIT